MKAIFKKKNLTLLMILALTLLMFAGCSNHQDVSACLEGKTYGFWNGLWHGIIAPIDLIGMLFRDDVSVYAENNNGAWYAFGFLIGSGGWGIMGGKTLGGKSSD